MFGDCFSEKQALGVRIGCQVHLTKRIPYSFRWTDGADTGAEIQDVFGITVSRNLGNAVFFFVLAALLVVFERLASASARE